ncbi:MAG TPA: hypothetical protein VGH32_08780, partial [Pirellulales bacterium]
MVSERHTIRKIEFSEPHDFDEQLWPVNLALVLAGGCMAGLIWAICDFRTPVLLENGYFWMTVLLVSVFGLGGLAVYLGGRSGRRLQMAAFLSLALHGVGLASMKVTEPTPDPNLGVAGNKRELRAIDTLPDYHLTRALPKAAREELEKPVETKLPDKLAIEAAQQRLREPQSGDAAPLSPKNDLVAIADSAPKLISPPLERKPIEPAAPRRGDLDAKLAKQQAPEATAPAAGPVKSIDLSVPTTKAGPIEARSMPLGRQTTDPTVPRRPDDNAVAMISGLALPGGPRSAPAPRTSDTSSPLVALGPKLVKTITEPGPAPRGEVPEPAAAAKAAVPDLSKLQPATGVSRQASAGAIVGRTGMELASIEPIASPRVAVSSRDPARASSAEPKLLDHSTPPRIASRASSPAAAPIADIAKSAGQTSARSADGGPGRGSLDSAEIKVARGSPAANAPPRTAGPKSTPLEGAGGFGVTVAMAGPQPGKAQDAAGPRPDPALPLGGAVGPGKPGFAGIGSIPTAAPVAGLPSAAPPGGIAGTAGRSAPSDSPADGPARVGIAKSAGGRVGPGRGEGFDAGMAEAAPRMGVSAAIGNGGGLSRRHG